jgi:hypothetical protein
MEFHLYRCRRVSSVSLLNPCGSLSTLSAALKGDEVAPPHTTANFDKLVMPPAELVTADWSR